MTDANETMSTLIDVRDQAGVRLAQFESDQRTAHEAVMEARAAVVAFERRKLEQALAAAEATAAVTTIIERRVSRTTSS